MKLARITTALSAATIALILAACAGQTDTPQTGVSKAEQEAAKQRIIDYLATDPDWHKRDRQEWLDKFAKVWVKYDKEKLIVRKAEWDRLNDTDKYILVLTVAQVAHDTPKNAQVDKSVKVYDEKNVLITTLHGSSGPWEAAPKAKETPRETLKETEPTSTLPTKTIVPDKSPVPVGYDKQTLDAYNAKPSPKMIEDGLVVLVKEPTKVRYEMTLGKYAYIRMNEGILKDRLAHVEAKYLK